MTTALAHVIAARHRLRVLRLAAGVPATGPRTTATGNPVARALTAPAEALMQVLTSDAVLDHLDQSLTEHIWAETIRHDDEVNYVGADASALAAAILPGRVQQPTPAQWRLLRHVTAGRVFRPEKGDPVQLPKPIKKGKPTLSAGDPVNGKTFQALIDLGLVEVCWWWKGIEKATATDAGIALLGEHQRANRHLIAA